MWHWEHKGQSGTKSGLERRRRQEEKQRALQFYSILWLSSLGKNGIVAVGVWAVHFFKIKENEVVWFVFWRLKKHAWEITTPLSLPVRSEHYSFCPQLSHSACPSLNHLHLLRCPAFPLTSFHCLTCCLCDLYFLLSCVYHFKHQWEKTKYK